MAPRLNPQQDERTRTAIKTSQLVNRLQGFALNELDAQTDKPVEMSPAQVKAAVALLKKTIPDLQAIEMAADVRVNHEQAIEQLK